MISFVPQIHVKVSVFVVNHEDEDYNVIYDSFASTRILLQRSNMIEKIKVDGHPFVIKYNYPIVDVLYDNQEQELLASLNIEDRDSAEIDDTSINTIGYCLSVEVTRIKEELELDFVEDSDDCEDGDKDFEDSFNYYQDADNMVLTINKCPLDEYTITHFTSSEDYITYNDKDALSEFNCKISEEVSNNDILIGLIICPFKQANLKLIKNYYSEYKHWGKLIEYQESLNS